MSSLKLLFNRRSRSDPSSSNNNSSFSLMELIIREDWKLALMECHANPREVRKWMYRQAFFDGMHATRVLPMHQACALCPPPSVIEALYESYPEGIVARDSLYKRTPLHIACQTNASLQVVQTLLKLDHHGESCKSKDALGRLPLHYACSHGASQEVVGALLDTFPAAVACADCKGWLPLHVACRFGDDEGVIRLLIQYLPSSLEISTHKGTLPLACAKKMSDPQHERIVHILEDSIMETKTND